MSKTLGFWKAGGNLTVEQSDVVDFCTLIDGVVVLTISDHLPWNEVHKHLFILQEKLNAYLRFVESGEIFRTYPHLGGQPVAIRIAQKHLVPADAQWFFEQTGEVLRRAGLGFQISN